MSRIELTRGDVAFGNFRRKYVPVASTVIATFVPILPIVVSTLWIPHFSFLVLIAWRLLRPEMWTAAVALPFGLLDDIVAGHPIGQSMAIWTATFLLLDLIDSRAIYRDYGMDWLIASFLILGYSFATWTVGQIMGSEMRLLALWPQVLLSVFSYPLVARLVVALDRWRLSR